MNESNQDHDVCAEFHAENLLSARLFTQLIFAVKLLGRCYGFFKNISEKTLVSEFSNCGSRKFFAIDLRRNSSFGSF